MKSLTEYPTDVVDHSWFGKANKFSWRAPYDLPAPLRVGDHVWIADDGVKPYLCRVVEVIANGEYNLYERLEPWEANNDDDQ